MKTSEIKHLDCPFEIKSYIRRLSIVQLSAGELIVKDFYLKTAVIISGAAVLALEILGTRLLGPFYGVSLFLWSVLITTTLLALSIGYAVGGRMADMYPSYGRLHAVLGIAGGWIAFIPWIRHPILALIEPLGLRPAVLIASFVLFFPPLTLLGMISPYAIKLKAANLTQLGRTAGNLYSLSTFASVVSALAMGSFLIPYVGVSRLVLIVGLLLIILAAIGYSVGKKTKVITLLLPSLVVSVVGIGRPPGESAAPAAGLLTVQESQYGELRVIDAKDARHLVIDGSLHGLVDRGSFVSNFPYASLMELPCYFHSKPGKMLLIGLGAGSLAKYYTKNNWTIDAVEIDQEVVNLAHQYFGLQPSEATIFTMDGREFLNTSRERYDVILLDAFGSSSIPFHLVTREVFQLMKSHLEPRGILAINVETLGWHDIVVRSLAATLHTSFDRVIALPIAEPPTEFGNLVLFASDSALSLEKEIMRDYSNPDFRFSPNYWKVHGWDNQFEPNITQAPVLTDDLNPIDTWAEDVNFAARKDLHKYFAGTAASW